MAGNGINRSPTQVDAQISTGVSSGLVPSTKAPPGYFTEDSYSMRNKTRGIALIFNNTKFEPRSGLSERNGSDEDATRLYDILQSLKFEVIIRVNAETETMMKQIFEVAQRDHSMFDCFIMCILSHGSENCIYTYDDMIKLEDLSDPFKGDKCISLAGKPKLFFIQACQGNKLDHGVDLEHSIVFDAVSFQRIPTEADFLFAYSSVSGYYSWRHKIQGSWFIQALCAELEKNKGHDLLRVLTRVNRSVALQKESYVPYCEMHRCKQMPYFKSMLTKELYFNINS